MPRWFGDSAAVPDAPRFIRRQVGPPWAEDGREAAPRRPGGEAALECVKKLLTAHRLQAGRSRGLSSAAMAIDRWAKDEAERLLGAMDDRWGHVQAVARLADQASGVVGEEDRPAR